MNFSRLKHKKIFISLFVIFLAIYLYSNKSYSLYELKYVEKLDLQRDIQSKYFYARKFSIDETLKNEKKFIVKKNQNLISIFKAVGKYPPKKLLKKSKDNCFYYLKIKDEIIINIIDNEINEVIKKNKKDFCIYTRKDNNIKKSTPTSEIETKQFVFFNRISSSFYNSALDAGMSANEVMSLADIYGWDIDFSMDIRSGDSFGVVIERSFSKKKNLKSEIKYSIFKNKKRILEAYRYQDKYFDIK